MTAPTASVLSSLRLRLTAYSGLLAFLLLLATWIVVAVGSQSYAVSNSQAILDAVCKELIDEMEPSETAETDFPEMIEEVIEATLQTSERLAVLHIKGDRVVNSFPNDAPEWPLASRREWVTSVLPFHGDRLVVALYFGETQNTLYWEVLVFTVVCLGTFLLAVLGSWVLVGAVLSPISDLSRQARSAETDLKARLEPPTTDAEITELVTTFNLFLDRLTESTELRARFYAAASHELRTPLQALLGHLELALNKERESGDYKAALSEAREQTQRLVSLTQALLTLNRLEVDSVHQCETVDLVDYCENEWLKVKQQAQAKQLRVTCSLPQSIDFVTLPTYLTILVRNLLDNAVKYSPEGGEFRLTLVPGPGEAIATLTLFNECEAIDDDDFERLKEPFFRPDRSRQSSTGGNGLGVAICCAVAKRQNWGLEFSQRDGGFQAQVLFRAEGGSKEVLR